MINSTKTITPPVTPPPIIGALLLLSLPSIDSAIYTISDKFIVTYKPRILTYVGSYNIAGLLVTYVAHNLLDMYSYVYIYTYMKICTDLVNR